MPERAGESDVQVSRSLTAQISKHATVNVALDLQAAPHQASRAGAAAILKAAVADIVGSIPPGVVASDSIISEEAMLQVVADRVCSSNYGLYCSQLQ